MLPIIVCCNTDKHLNVLEASIKSYAPEVKLLRYRSTGASSGESFNAALDDAFLSYDEVIIANDDIVLTPNTMTEFMEDVKGLKHWHGDKLGLVATYSNEVRHVQNIRYNERIMRNLGCVSPIFAYMSKAAYQVAPFPPIDWYGDDVVCEDLIAAGFYNYVSKAYVHHVGSATIGHDYSALIEASKPWIIENRPQYYSKWF